MAPPSEYVHFTQRRRLWQDLGEHMDDMEHGAVEEALLFIRLEEHYREHEAKKESP